MTDATINVGICLDARMLNAAFVLLASIKAHARAERPIAVYALTSFVSPELDDLAVAMGDARFTLKPIAVEDVDAALPVRDHISHGTYLRFLLQDLLPDVGKIIYIDVDTVVHHDLAPLFDVDLAGCALAGMPDYPMIVGSPTWPTFFIPFEGQRFRFAAYVEKILQLPRTSGPNYFNCGVMVLDLDLWRTRDLSRATLAYLAERSDLFFMDQDALNHEIAGAYVPLDPRWNAFANCTFPAYVNVFVRLTRAGRAWERMRAIWRRDPWIVHYAGANKPWAPHEPKTPKDDLWWHYAMQSPMKARVVADYRAKETKAQERRSKIPRLSGAL